MKEDLTSKASELMKKVLTAGISAAFLTEEGVRSLMGDLKLPKELVTGLLESAKKTRQEFFQNLIHELVDRVMAQVDPKEMTDHILKNYDFEFQVKVKAQPKQSKHGSEKS